MILTKRGYIVPKGKYDDKIRKDLNVTPVVHFSDVQIPSFPVFRESNSRYRVPRFYAISEFGLPSVPSSIDGVRVELEFKGILKRETQQHVAVEKAMAEMHVHGTHGGGGILSLPPGYGKTTVALYIASLLKTKTIVIVHKEFLMNQWIERIAMFLPDAKVGKIRQNQVDTDCDISIAMLQSLASKDYPKGTFDSFGLTIVDETHHICSRVFSNALFQVCTKYTLGLSATPDRKDGLTKVLKWFMGPIFFKVERKQQKKVEVIVSKYGYDKPLALNKMGKVSMVNVINDLVTVDSRNKIIVDHVKWLISQDRNIMVLSERREHCELIHSEIEQFKPGSSGLYMGGMKQHELDHSETKQVIIATFSLAHEGLDIPKLDSLVLATPKADVVQACGRIMRETKGKLWHPLIIDIVDTPLQGQFKKRQTFYKRSGFTIRNDQEKSPKKKQVAPTLDDYAFVEDV